DLEAVMLAYWQVVEAGLTPAPEEWIARFPHLATELEEFFAGQRLLDRLAEPLRAALKGDLATGTKANDPPRPAEHHPGNNLDPQATGRYVPEPLNSAGTIPPGAVLMNRYAVERELGRGGMGLVYLARDQVLERLVAVKLVRPRDPHLRERTLSEQNLRQAFVREAVIGANLNHPAIATVFDFGFYDNEPMIVFEYVDGETLQQTLASRGRLPLADVRLILASLAQALQFAHARQIVHRDLKPANIRSTIHGQYKILDLGLATEFRQAADWRFAGTPRYASPEQAAGLACDGRTDQYALGLIAFEMLTGRPVFEAASVAEMLRLHREQPPPALRSF